MYKIRDLKPKKDFQLMGTRFKVGDKIILNDDGSEVCLLYCEEGYVKKTFFELKEYHISTLSNLLENCEENLLFSYKE